MIATFTKPDIWTHATHRAVAAIGSVQGLVRCYIFIWGDSDHRDSYGTFVDPARPPQLDLENGMHRRPVKYEHSVDGEIRMETIGVITEYGYDDTGIYADVQLDMSSPYAPRVLEEISRAELKTSSATMPHTADFYEDGAFKKWTVGELSFTKTPSEPRMPEVVLVRSDDDAEARRDAVRVTEATDLATHGASAPQDERAVSTPMEEIMTLQEQIAAIMADPNLGEEEKVAQIAALMTPAEEPVAMADNAMPEDEEEPVAMSAPVARSASAEDTLLKRFEALERTMTKIANAATRANNAPPARETKRTGGAGVNGGQITNMVDLSTAHRTTAQLLLSNMLMRAHGVEPSENFRRAAAGRLVEDAEKDKIRTPALAAFARARRVDGLTSNTRADELMAVGIATQGAEWAPIAYTDFVWQLARAQTVMAAFISRGMIEREVPAGADSTDVYLATSDMTWYTGAEARSLDSTGRPASTVRLTVVGTNKLNVAPAELVAGGSWSYRLDEGSIINISAEVDRNINATYAEALEFILLNGDTRTTASTNINLIDGTPASGLYTPLYLNSNGVIYNGLVTSGRNRSAGGAFADTDFLATKKLLTTRVRSQDPNKMLFVVDVPTYDAALDQASGKTGDVEPSGYTLKTGRVPAKYGIEVVQSGQMNLANNAGKVTAAVDGTLGRIVLTYPEYLAMVYARMLTIETSRDIEAGANIVVARARASVQLRSNDASAVTYNVGVA